MFHVKRCLPDRALEECVDGSSAPARKRTRKQSAGAVRPLTGVEGWLSRRTCRCPRAPLPLCAASGMSSYRTSRGLHGAVILRLPPPFADRQLRGAEAPMSGPVRARRAASTPHPMRWSDLRGPARALLYRLTCVHAHGTPRAESADGGSCRYASVPGLGTPMSPVARSAWARALYRGASPTFPAGKRARLVCRCPVRARRPASAAHPVVSSPDLSGPARCRAASFTFANREHREGGSADGGSPPCASTPEGATHPMSGRHIGVGCLTPCCHP